MNSDQSEFPEQLRQHYASLSDAGLLEIDRADLVDMAQALYDDELSRRQLPSLAVEAVAVPDHGESVPFWHLDIRKAALLACIATVATNILPARNFLGTVLAVQSEHTRWWILPALAEMSLMVTIIPLFYFALYRNQGALRFPRSLRLLALAGAFAISTFMAGNILGWIKQFRPNSVLMDATPLTAGDVLRLLVRLSDLAAILVLILIYRQASPTSPMRAPVSKMLAVITKVAVITWGLWVTFHFVRLLATPFTYIQVQSYWSQLRQTPPPFGDVVWDAARALLSQAGLLVAPYIVWRGSLRADKE